MKPADDYRWQATSMISQVAQMIVLQDSDLSCTGVRMPQIVGYQGEINFNLEQFS
jgi:hypothetical protein